MYDPAYVRDPKDLGLIDAQGNRIDSPRGRAAAQRSSRKTFHKLTTAFSPEKVSLRHERHEIDLP